MPTTRKSALSNEVVCVCLACFFPHADKRVTSHREAPLPVDVDIPAQGVTLAPLGRLSCRGKTRSLEAHGLLAHFVEDVHIIDQLVVLASDRLALDRAESCVFSARGVTARVTGLAHATQAPGVTVGEVVQAVLHS